MEFILKLNKKNVDLTVMGVKKNEKKVKACEDLHTVRRSGDGKRMERREE